MPPNLIVSTAFLLPTAVISNGDTTGNGFTNPNNILLVDGDVASSNPGVGVASDITIGNFLTNLPQNAVVVGIEMELIGYRGAQTSPVITVTPYLYDNTNGANNYYPYITPFTGLTTTIGTYVLGTPTYLFASSFTVDQINNMKMNLVVNGDVSIDSFLIKVYYYEQTSGTPVTPVVGTCTDCDSVIQVPEMRLALPFLINQTKFYLQAGSFTYVDGTPVQPGDVGGCGGEINFVFDEGKRKIAGQNFEENAIVDIATGSWQVLPSGIIEVDIVNVTNRGLEPKTPYGHNANLMSDHDANSTVIISNSGRFYKRFVRQCEADVTFSRPIDVEKDEANVVNPIHTLNFKGTGVTVQQNGTDPFQADITIAGSGTSTPTQDSTSSATSGSTQVAQSTWSHTCLGTDRLLTVQISMEEGKTVTALTYNGIAMTFEIADELNGTRMEVWSLVAPSVGTHDIDVTFSSASYFSGGAESWVGVDQTTPVGTTVSATGTSLAPSLVVNTLYDNSVIVDGLSTALTPILLTPGAGQIENWHEYANTDTRQGASSYEVAGTAPDAVTMDYTITQNTDWSLCAIEIKGLTTVVANLVVEDEGVVIDSNVSNIDYVGAGVTVTQTAPGQVQVSIPGGAATDELVKVSAADTTAGYLQPKLNVHSSDGSVTVTETITNPAGNEVLDIDLTGAGSSVSTTNVSVPLDDFTSALESDVATDVYYTSGNFGIFSGTNLSSEQDHPGIVTLNTTADILKGFFQLQADETQVTGLLDYDNDFDITILTRLRYSGGNAWEVLFNLDGGGGNIAQVVIDGTNGVRYDVGGGLVVTAVPTPANNAWVKLQYQLVSGTLTIILDGNTVFSGAIAHTNPFGIVGSVTTATDLDGFDFDYVLTNYTVTR